jgi:hypothetical protein
MAYLCGFSLAKSCLKSDQRPGKMQNRKFSKIANYILATFLSKKPIFLDPIWPEILTNKRLLPQKYTQQYVPHDGNSSILHAFS